MCTEVVANYASPKTEHCFGDKDVSCTITQVGSV